MSQQEPDSFLPRIYRDNPRFVPTPAPAPIPVTNNLLDNFLEGNNVNDMVKRAPTHPITAAQYNDFIQNRYQSRRNKARAKRGAKRKQLPTYPPEQSVNYTLGGQKGSGYRNQPPKITPYPMGMLVEKTEAISMIPQSGGPNFPTAGSAPGAFFAQNFDFYPLNAGMAWLASIAKVYTNYEVHRLEFTYVPSQPTTVGGTIVMYWQPDYADSFASNLAEAQQSEQALSAPTYAGADGGNQVQSWGFRGQNVVGFTVPAYTYTIGTIPMRMRIQNTTDFNTGSAADRNSLSPGRLVFCSVGSNLSAQTLGTIFVRYRIRLFGAIAPGDQG